MEQTLNLATYKDCDGIIQKYEDWGVELVKDIDLNHAIVRGDNGRYTIWSKNYNRERSKINPRNNEYVPIWYNSLEEAIKNVYK